MVAAESFPAHFLNPRLANDCSSAFIGEPSTTPDAPRLREHVRDRAFEEAESTQFRPVVYMQRAIRRRLRSGVVIDRLVLHEREVLVHFLRVSEDGETRNAPSPSEGPRVRADAPTSDGNDLRGRKEQLRGYQFELWHGGAPPTFHEGDEDAGGRHRDDESLTVSYEENCKPNYPSTMSYLFQLHGLLDDAGVPHLDYSRDDSADLDEAHLSDGAMGTLRYRAAWYAPIRTPAAAGIPAAKKFCNGASFPSAGVPVPMGRVEAPSVSAPID